MPELKVSMIKTVDYYCIIANGKDTQGGKGKRGRKDRSGG